MLAFGCWLCSCLAAACARVWLLLVLVFGCWLCLWDKLDNEQLVFNML